jgi:hypothetical protein
MFRLIPYHASKVTSCIYYEENGGDFILFINITYLVKLKTSILELKPPLLMVVGCIVWRTGPMKPLEGKKGNKIH